MEQGHERIVQLIKSENLPELVDFLAGTKLSPAKLEKGEETPLNLAATKLNEDIIRLLLQNGFNPKAKDSFGRTPVLCVALRLKECGCEHCTRKCIKCINLLGEYGADFGSSDNEGNTALSFAAEISSLELTTALLRNGAPLDTNGDCKKIRRRNWHKGREENVLSVISQKLPSVLLDIFDRAVTIQGNAGIHDLDCEVAFDLSVILPSQATDFKENSSGNKVYPVFKGVQEKQENAENDTESIETTKYEPQREMGYLNTLLESHYKSSDFKTTKAILRHPLITVFTDVKWRSLELMFFVYIFLQTLVLLAFTTFLFITIFVDCPFNSMHQNHTIQDLRKDSLEKNLVSNLIVPTEAKLCQLQLTSKMISAYVLFCTLVVFLKEIHHLFHDFKEYCTDILNHIQLFGLFSVAGTIAIAWEPSSRWYEWLFPVAALGVTISWCQIFIQIGRFPKLAIYVDMLAKIVVNFVYSLSIYSFLLVGFGMSYCVLFSTEPSIVDIPLALVKMLTMMVGELDYESLFKDSNVQHPIAAHFWYICSVIVLTLVLMNLLVGLAVSDIQRCKDDAEVYVMKRRIRYTSYLEKSFYLWTQILPRIMRNYFRRKVALVKTNENDSNIFYCFQMHKIPIKGCTMIIRPNDPNLRFLSEESKNAVKFWLQKRPRDRVLKKDCKFISQEKNSEKDLERNNSVDQELGQGRTLSAKSIENRLQELDSKLELVLELVSKQNLEDKI